MLPGQSRHTTRVLIVCSRDGYGECVLILCKAGADCYKTNSEGKTAKDLADMATEQETVEFLAKAETGLVPDQAPKKKEREAIQHKANAHSILSLKTVFIYKLKPSS